METDILLYKEFLTGNNNAFDMLMNKYRNVLIYFIQSYVKNRDIAEDLAQDVFLYMLINKKEYDFKYSFKTYLYTIARSRSINYLKRAKKVISIEDNINYYENTEYINQIEEKIISDEKKAKVQKAIKCLNENQQIIIYLADIEDLSYKDICKITGKNLPQIKMLIYRCRKKIKKIIEKEELNNG